MSYLNKRSPTNPNDLICNGLIKSQTTSLNLGFVLTDYKSLLQDHTGQAPPCDMTEKRIFTMGAQIGSALVR